MSYAPIYVIGRFLFRVVNFFHHWYIDASRWFIHSFFSFLESLDVTFAVHITMRHFFEPLYGDYSIVGRILGIVFRSGRVLIGGMIYAALACTFLVAYVAWLVAPILLIIFILRNIPGATVGMLPY